jgi:hypothetical protein
MGFRSFLGKSVWVCQARIWREKKRLPILSISSLKSLRAHTNEDKCYKFTQIMRRRIIITRPTSTGGG